MLIVLFGELLARHIDVVGYGVCVYSWSKRAWEMTPPNLKQPTIWATILRRDRNGSSEDCGFPHPFLDWQTHFGAWMRGGAPVVGYSLPFTPIFIHCLVFHTTLHFETGPLQCSTSSRPRIWTCWWTVITGWTILIAYGSWLRTFLSRMDLQF